MPPGKPWAYGNMSMRNPMSRAPMNNNPMGNQAPMQPNFGRAVGAAGSTSLPYAGGSLGMAGPASAAQGMTAVMGPKPAAPQASPGYGREVGAVAGLSSWYTPGGVGMAGPAGIAQDMASMRPAAPAVTPRQAPQSTPYRRAMSGGPIFGQNGIGSQRAAQNDLMGQPMGADTRMRGLNIPGMTFDPATNSMVRAPRPQLTVNPNPERWGRMNSPNVGTGEPMTGAQSRMNTRISRMARARGVRGGDIPEWSRLSPAAIAMRQRAGQMPGSAGPTGGNPAPMGPSQGPPAANTLAGAPAVTPPAVPPVNQPVQQAVQEESPEMRYRRERDAQYFNRAMELQNTAGTSLAGQVIGGVSLGANRMLSQARDGYTNLLQGTPPDSPYAEQSEEQRTKRLLNMPGGTRPAPELPMRARLERPPLPEAWRREFYPRSYAGR